MKASALLFTACSVALAAAAPVPDQLQDEPQGINQVVENADYALGTFAPWCSGNKPDCGEQRETHILVYFSNRPCVKVICGGKSGIEPVSISAEKYKEEYEHQKEPRDIKQVEVNTIWRPGKYPFCSPSDKPDCGENRETLVLWYFSNGPCYKVVCGGKSGIEPVSISTEKYKEEYEHQKEPRDIKPVEANTDRTLGTWPMCSPGSTPDCRNGVLKPIMAKSPTGPCMELVCGGKPGSQPVPFSAFEEGYEDNNPDHDVPPPKSRGSPPPKNDIV
ncbi:protein of unknown function [Taphrina deformans PYCC 5710]|uniref:Secreted protein n=1 Tax=Taphrina deformans (strain PYCC 5710 / ATCC 11124 / CBS 356.35 / IMI 108563 / JCM 9778 / NBRC 8474) TaxID=1097556 RepID=R4XH31_TAPDE|nr:protein of unknown function [Taphrina deformans PYCC 5710]|eukprot:CCG83828.1 protein of unknown function [Taphrina deformans PYCC 5710]